MDTEERQDKDILFKELISEKSKLLTQMKHEILKLEFDLKHPKVANLKINSLKIFKIFLHFQQLIAPYVLAAGITFGALKALDMTPFC